MNNIYDRSDLIESFVPENILERVQKPHSSQTPALPFTWFVSYTAESALQNIRYCENGVRRCQLEFPIRVFLSHWTDAIIVTFVPLEALRDPHVQEWYVTFYEVPVEDVKVRLATYPKFPYDGRSADLVRAEMLAGGDIQRLLKTSYDQLRKKGVPLLTKF